MKTSVKANLYWEIKDKVIEESFNGTRLDRRPRKVKVYGTDSTKDVRARLIEILYDRVAYHKDKFIAPILHQEMEAMEVKKNGKVEHSDNSHDDQVFSYLMALYVWYEGKNLAENFHIIKNTLKTDVDEEFEENEIEQFMEPKATVDLEQSSLYDEEDEKIAGITKDLRWLEDQSKIRSYDQVKEENYLAEIQRRNTILQTDRKARESYARERGLDPEMFDGANPTFGNITIPDSIFLDDDGIEEETHMSLNNVPLAGNLSGFWNDV